MVYIDDAISRYRTRSLTLFCNSGKNFISPGNDLAVSLNLRGRILRSRSLFSRRANQNRGRGKENELSKHRSKGKQQKERAGQIVRRLHRQTRLYETRVRERERERNRSLSLANCLYYNTSIARSRSSKFISFLRDTGSCTLSAWSRNVQQDGEKEEGNWDGEKDREKESFASPCVKVADFASDWPAFRAFLCLWKLARIQYRFGQSRLSTSGRTYRG